MWCGIARPYFFHRTITYTNPANLDQPSAATPRHGEFRAQPEGARAHPHFACAGVRQTTTHAPSQPTARSREREIDSPRAERTHRREHVSRRTLAVARGARGLSCRAHPRRGRAGATMDVTMDGRRWILVVRACQPSAVRSAPHATTPPRRATRARRSSWNRSFSFFSLHVAASGSPSLLCAPRRRYDRPPFRGAAMAIAVALATRLRAPPSPLGADLSTTRVAARRVRRSPPPRSRPPRPPPPLRSSASRARKRNEGTTLAR